MRLSYSEPTCGGTLGPGDPKAVADAERAAEAVRPHVEAHLDTVERLCGVRPTVRLAWELDGEWIAVWAIDLPAGFERYGMDATRLHEAARTIDPNAPAVTYRWNSAIA